MEKTQRIQSLVIFYCLVMLLLTGCWSSNKIKISAGVAHTCAVVSGGVKCWGDNNYKQILNSDVRGYTKATEVIKKNSGAIDVAAGMHHSCAVVNGGVKCWGSSDKGETGEGKVEGIRDVIPEKSGVTAVAVGRYHSCAIVNGGARCWGWNGDGQLGDGSVKNSSTPVEAIASNSGVTALALGYYHSCAIVNGGVKCWGSNSSGQLGRIGEDISKKPVETIPANSGVTVIASELMHTCVIVKGGLKCWGLNMNGQNCHSNLAGIETKPHEILPENSKVQSVVAVGNFTCALVSDKIKCCGPLGYVTRVPPVEKNIDSLVAGEAHGCYIKGNAVKCWGANPTGQLGNGTTTDSDTPEEVLDL